MPRRAFLRAFTFDSSRRLNRHSNLVADSRAACGEISASTTGTRIGSVWGCADAGEMGSQMANIENAAYAAEPADADACFALGMNYSTGADVAIDLVSAHKWFNIAAACGHGDAARLRREVAEQMSDGEIGRAQRAARDWLKAHPQPQAAPAIRAAA
jgi:TPR repeat protein